MKHYDVLLKETKYRELINDQDGLAYAYKNIGECFRFFSEYINAINYLEKSLEIYKNINSKLGIAKVLNRLGAVYYEYENNYDKAIYYSTESNKFAKEINEIEVEASNDITIGSSYIKKNDSRNSIYFLKKALELIELKPNSDNRSLVYKNLADAYKHSGNIEKALEFSYKSYYCAVEKKIKYNQLLSLNSLFTYYRYLGKNDSADKYELMYNEIYNQVYNKEKERAVFQIEAKYQREQYKRNEEAQQKQRDMIYLIYSIITIAILIILFLIYFRYKKFRRINQELEENKILIEKQKEALTKSNATKDKFFMILSHDLKNPISSFSNLAEILSSEYSVLSDRERLNFAQSLDKSSKSILKLLEDLLAWSIAQTNNLNIIKEDFILNDAIENEITTLLDFAKSKNININFTPIKRHSIFADQEMTSTIIRNFICNAIKFSNKDSQIDIKISEDEKYSTVSVKDYGIGIPDSEKSRLFSIEVKHSTLGTNNEKGSGLGLQLCKELVEKNNGYINYESQLNLGSTFSFSLPKTILE